MGRGRVGRKEMKVKRELSDRHAAVLFFFIIRNHYSLCSHSINTFLQSSVGVKSCCGYGTYN